MNYLEWLGYLASFIILISIVMNSLVKLRWINLAGSLIFVFYGIMIDAMPVAFMNSGIVIINIYYLVKMYQSKEYFHILPINKSTTYLEEFIRFHKTDMEKHFDRSDFTFEDDSFGFYILRNMVPAGLFLAKKSNDDSLVVELDFAIPAYRDTKIGRYIYHDNQEFFKSQNIKRIETFATCDKHRNYLSKMGFIRREDDSYYFNII